MASFGESSQSFFLRRMSADRRLLASRPACLFRGYSTADLGDQAIASCAARSRTTLNYKAAPCPLDRVNLDFLAPAPNMPWVSDFTYVST